MLLLLEAYLDGGRVRSAATLASGKSLNDAHFDILKGRLAQKQGKDLAALRLFESALTKPSAMRDRISVRRDALFYTALVRSVHFRSSPSTETRTSSMMAWNALKRAYADAKKHPRFIQANKELAAFN